MFSTDCLVAREETESKTRRSQQNSYFCSPTNIVLLLLLPCCGPVCRIYDGDMIEFLQLSPSHRKVKKIFVSAMLFLFYRDTVTNVVFLTSIRLTYVISGPQCHTYLISSRVSHVVISDCMKSKYEVAVATSGIKFTSSFVKIGQLFQNLESGDTHAW